MVLGKVHLFDVHVEKFLLWKQTVWRFLSDSYVTYVACRRPSNYASKNGETNFYSSPGSGLPLILWLLILSYCQYFFLFSALIVRFLTRRFITEYHRTLGGQDCVPVSNHLRAKKFRNDKTSNQMFLILKLTVLVNVHWYFFNLDSVLRYEHKLLEISSKIIYLI